MEAGGKPDFAEQIAGALAWWQDAGVDLDFCDEAVDWLVKAAPESGEKASPNVGFERPAAAAEHPTEGSGRFRTQPVPALDPTGLPDDLTAFVDWWLREPSLDGGIVSRRVPPRGPAAPELMIIVPEPEEDDTERLLSGPHGRLLDGVLKALGMTEDRVYLASALPRRMPLPDWAALAAAGLGQALQHHVELVAPGRILMFGSSILPLIGNDSPLNARILPSVNHVGDGFPLMVERDLAALVARPRSKAGLWNRLLDWMGN